MAHGDDVFVLGHTGLLWMQYGFRIAMVWLVKLITDPFTDVAAMAIPPPSTCGPALTGRRRDGTPSRRTSAATAKGSEKKTQ